ncbi:hypothetical protein GO003_018920 [Methylicorpusculum oleiharenae]|uniref:hypothetical protein n=1 Tax=Methylicorpusculum oleiharenae TaxID=1338687 RepID=UPI00135A5B8A|nr:hypothetical protein [Methylicorpusculum oleiharenae]MCD2452460.1 hypothetical protein [Methylicorpusculum oleiharenae]
MAGSGNHRKERVNDAPTPTRQTLLGGVCTSLTKEEIVRRDVAKEAIEACRVILEEILSAYADGELTFENAIKTATEASKAERVPRDYQAKKMLAAFVQALVNITPKPRTKSSARSQPSWLKKLAIELVSLVVEKESLPKSRESKNQTAYERVSEILDMRGIKLSVREIERIYTKKRN